MMLSRILGFVAIAVVGVLSGCGGGGGGPLPTGGDRDVPVVEKYPDCKLSPMVGKGNITGCWLSERCATNTSNSVPVRYLAEITEEEFAPVTKGAINHYLMIYDNQQCEGEPVDVVAMADWLQETENAVLNVRYARQGDDSIIPWAICTDTMEQFGSIPCLAIDITSDYQRGNGPVFTRTSRDTYHYAGGPKTNGEGSADEWYLCMSSAYRFDDTGQGGIGVGDLWDVRDTVLDLTDCLTRFEPDRYR